MIVRARKGAVYRLSFAILGDEADARDAAQETLVAVWRQLRGLREPERVDVCLQRVVVNAARQVMRTNRRAADASGWAVGGRRRRIVSASGRPEEPPTRPCRLPRVLPVNAEDRACFEALFEQHHRAVLAYLLRRTRNEADAEDLAAETFAVAWRRRDAIPPDPRPWLFAVARRVVANQRRGAGRWERLLDRLRLQPERVETMPSGAGPAIDALTTLSEDDQELLKLVAWEDFSHAEIAASLAITTNAVAIRLHRARQRYAQAYAALGGSSMKGFGARRTSLPVTGSSIGSWRHEDT